MLNYKQLLLLLILVGMSLPALSIGFGQGNWRWRNDDGDDTSATWKADERTPIVLTHKNNIRLRVQMGNTFLLNLSADIIELGYSYDDGTNWFVIEDDETSGHFVYAESPHFTNQDASTQQLSVFPGACDTFVPGFLFDTIDPLSPNNHPELDQGEGTELEFSIRATEQALDLTEYRFGLFTVFDISNETPMNLCSGTTTITLTTNFNAQQVPLAPWALFLAIALIISAKIFMVRRFY
ncbi:MAG: hypothetical protein EA394_01130 [Bacteroidia bacterium]|nr:MAG: hypothetical protein EA394_01130 [Bacteroidia bacterium]